MNLRTCRWILAITWLGCAPDRGVPDDDSPEPPPSPTLARAESLYTAGRFEEARNIWATEVTGAFARGDSAGAARLLTSIGLAEKNLGRYDESREVGQRALELKLELGLHRDLFRSYNALGLLAWDQDHFDEAADFFERATDAARAAGDSMGVAKAANNLALLDMGRGEPLKARAGFVRLRDVSRTVGDTISLSRALLNLASLDLQLGDPLAAVASVEEARLLAAATGDAEAEENALGQLATAYDALGEGQRAFAAIDSARALAESRGLRRRVAEDLQLLGSYYAAAGDHRRALDQYARAQAVNSELGLGLEEGNTLRSEAYSYRTLGHPDTALGRATRALAIHRAGGFRSAELADNLLLAELASDRNDRRGAAAAIDAARLTARTFGAPLAQAEVALVAARIHDRLGTPQAVLAALDSAGAALALVPESGSWEPDGLRARAYARLGRAETAELLGRRAVAAAERLRAGYGSGVLRTAYLSQRIDLYADLVLVLLARNRIAEAFEVADAARGRALLEHLGAARRELERSGGAGPLLRGEELLRRIDALTGRLREASGGPPGERSPGEEATRGIEAELDQARADYEALLARVSSTPGAATLLGVTTVGSQEIRQTLRPDEVLVEYLVSPDRLDIFAMNAAGIRHSTRPIGAVQLASRVRLARELIGHASSGVDDAPVLRELYRVLVEPLVAMGVLEGIGRLVVVPQGPLVYLPFAALQSPEGSFLIDRFAMVVLPSASSLAILRQRPGGASRLARGLALAPLSSELPASRDEVREMGRLLGAKVLVGDRASESALRRDLGTSPILHIASHGILNPINPMFSRLELAPGGSRRGGPDAGTAGQDDGRLEVHELLGLRVAAQLVFLSGCETGTGSAWRTAFQDREDYVTLAQAFLYAGAANVVATLWRVNDPAAAVFAGHFYGALTSAGDPVEALAQAQRAMRADSRYRAPYYWAAYQVSGSGFTQVAPAQLGARDGQERQ